MSIKEKWFISDTHFFHENIIKYCNRPFKDAQEMNEVLVENWNKVVKPNDNVYHLGDVACGYGQDERGLSTLLHSLNGNKRLIVGNHDRLKSPALHRAFEKIELWKGFNIPCKGAFTCSHIPLPLHHLRDGDVCVHGHIHNNVLANSTGYINVSVEVRGYAPVHLDTILTEIKEM
jgi:calcineurin-like phosphoesterase family protein